MSEVTLHEGADEEFKAAALFYESRRPGLGEAFVQRVVEGFESILAHPLSGQILFDEFRRHLIGQFPYSVVYRIEGNRIFVLAVAHWSRRPGYWKTRI